MWASLASYRAWNPEIAGSNPATLTTVLWGSQESPRPCHGRDRGFKSHQNRHFSRLLCGVRLVVSHGSVKAARGVQFLHATPPHVPKSGHVPVPETCLVSGTWTHPVWGRRIPCWVPLSPGSHVNSSCTHARLWPDQPLPPSLGGPRVPRWQWHDSCTLQVAGQCHPDTWGGKRRAKSGAAPTRGRLTVAPLRTLTITLTMTTCHESGYSTDEYSTDDDYSTDDEGAVRPLDHRGPTSGPRITTIPIGNGVSGILTGHRARHSGILPDSQSSA